VGVREMSDADRVGHICHGDVQLSGRILWLPKSPQEITAL